MTLSDLYSESLSLLLCNNIEDAEFEAKVLIKHYLNLTESDFYLKKFDTVETEIQRLIKEAVERRIDGEPVQYIIGEWDFMGYTFGVGKGVLIPRPETEILCEYIIRYANNLTNPVIFDLCTGSGCIGISVAKNVQNCEVYMVDKSSDALRYQSENVKKLCSGLSVNTVCADIFDMDAFTGFPKADIIVSNPPYIKSNEISTLQKEVLFEPSMALDGGLDGLVFYRHIISQWNKLLKENGLIAFECGEDQSDDIVCLFNANGFDTEVIKDYNNINRFVLGRRYR